MMIPITSNIQGWWDLWYYPDCDEVCESRLDCDPIFKFKLPKSVPPPQGWGMAFCLQHLLRYLTQKNMLHYNNSDRVSLLLKEFLKDHPDLVMEMD